MKKKLLVASLAIGIAAIVGMNENVNAEGTSTYTTNTGWTNNVVGDAGKGIVGSPHDLSNSGRGITYNNDDSLQRICVYCHAPHHTIKPGTTAAANIGYLPLWNHGVSVNQAFTVYSNGPHDPDEVDAAGNPVNHQLTAAIGQPGSVSRLCLSCHDGSVAVNQYGFDPGRAESRGTADGDGKMIQGSFLIGGSGNLSNHHPIGFDYDAVAAADDEIASSSQKFGTFGTVASPDNLTIADLLYSGQMECVTCHDVHNTKNTGETFLWVSDQGSKFCCTCHLKCQ